MEMACMTLSVKCAQPGCTSLRMAKRNANQPERDFMLAELALSRNLHVPEVHTQILRTVVKVVLTVNLGNSSQRKEKRCANQHELDITSTNLVLSTKFHALREHDPILRMAVNLVSIVNLGSFSQQKARIGALW